MKAYITPGSVHGSLSVPGSKSHTIRAVLIGAMAGGTSRIANPLTSKDCQSAMLAAQAFGAKTRMENGVWTVEGVGGEFRTPADVIDTGNSGTTLYFATAIAALSDGYTVLTGDYQIRRRPIRELLSAIVQLGGEGFTTRSTVDASPAIVRGPLKAGVARFGGKFSQFISATLLVSPNLEGTTTILVDSPIEKPYLQMTLDWMSRQGIKVDFADKDYKRFEVSGRQAYKPVNATIESDWEGVAFPLAAAVLTDSDLVINDLDVPGGQGDSVIIDILQRMGADIVMDEKNRSLRARGGRTLKGIEIDCSDIPDAMPILSVVGACAEGVTRLTHLESVRVKETDRVAVMAAELAKMGAVIEYDDSTFTVRGGRRLNGCGVRSHDDHRVAMSLAVAGLAASGHTVIEDAGCVDISFPNFYELMRCVGAKMITESGGSDGTVS
jgi:3-phosphoshikimate 1-carboxyvinyltransferase